MEVINIADVLDITSNGLIYLNDVGQEKLISFEECRRNWVKHVNDNNFVDWKGNAVQLTFEKSSCIGSRHIAGGTPHLLLYGNPKLKIELKPNKESLTKIQKEMFVLLYQIGKVTTFDMT